MASQPDKAVGTADGQRDGQRAPSPSSKADSAGAHGNAPDPRPLEGYRALLATYGISAGLVVVALRGRRRAFRRLGLMDLVLVGLAVQRLTRTIAKDEVMAPLRAPFTRYEGPAGEGESNEAPVGHGLHRAVGELLTCPFCLGQWVATGLVAGRLAAPRLTGAAVEVLALAQANDYLQLAYAALRTRS